MFLAGICPQAVKCVLFYTCNPNCKCQISHWEVVEKLQYTYLTEAFADLKSYLNLKLFFCSMKEIFLEYCKTLLSALRGALP